MSYSSTLKTLSRASSVRTRVANRQMGDDGGTKLKQEKKTIAVAVVVAFASRTEVGPHQQNDSTEYKGISKV